MKPRPSRLKRRYGPWAVVTGASDGMGKECARELAAQGLNLVLVARRRVLLAELAAELHQTYGVQAQVIDIDLAQPTSVVQLLSATVDLNVGLLVAAAGFGTAGAVVQTNLDQELNLIDVNCRAVYALVHGYSRRFAARGSGGIVLFSSLLGWQGAPFAANYAATKAYVQALAEGLRVELRPHGVDVLASAPGPVSSGFAARANMRMAAAVTATNAARGTLRRLGHAATAIPGGLSKFLTWSLLPLPRSLRVRIMGLVMREMTRHHDSETPGSA